jgi:hypothetical protein
MDMGQPGTFITLDHIPDGFRHLEISERVSCDPVAVLSREGDCFVGKVEDFPSEDPTYRNHLHIQQRKIHVQPGALIPLILCYRRSIMELASRLEPYRLSAGDRVTMLGGDGYAGSYQCALDSYGKGVSVEIVGAITTQPEGRVLNSADGALPMPAAGSHRQPLVVAVLGVRMDSGKSTTIRRIAAGLQASGLSLAIGKVSGFGCLYETASLHSCPSVDFTDFGLPSTCGLDQDRILETADCVLSHLSRLNADVVILEFGGGLIDSYHADQVYRHLLDRIHFTVFVAFDLCGVRGGRDVLAELGGRINVVSGPLANTSLGVEQIWDWMQLPAESNQHAMERSCAAIVAAAAQLGRSGSQPGA